MSDSTAYTLSRENAVKRRLSVFPKSKIVKLLAGNILLPFFEECAAHV
jgi:hypothetical protein